MQPPPSRLHPPGDGKPITNLRRTMFEEKGQSREVTVVAAVAAAAAAAVALLDASRRRSSAKVKQTAAPAKSMRGRARGCLLCGVTRGAGWVTPRGRCRWGHTHTQRQLMLQGCRFSLGGGLYPPIARWGAH